MKKKYWALIIILSIFISQQTAYAQVDSYTKLLTHMEGADGSTTFTDETGKTITNPENYDSYTKLTLHADGSDGSTTFTDSATAKAVTANGDAQIDTAQSKFGGASGLFDGTGDYLTVPDSADWNFGSGDFTIDWWMRFSISGEWVGIYSQGDWWNDPDSVQIIWYFDGNSAEMYFLAKSGGSQVIRFFFDPTVNVNNWYHFAIVRNGNTWYAFVNGVSQALTLQGGSWSSTLPDLSYALNIGKRSNVEAGYFNGWIDEFRVSKGISRWTSNFVPPSKPYGKAYIDTSQKMFGSSSGLFGSGSYLSLADSDDWNFGSGDFTIDFWVRFNTLPINNNDIIMMVGQWASSSSKWAIYIWKNSGNLNWEVFMRGGLGDIYWNSGTVTPSMNTWYHIAWVRNSNEFKFYVNEAQVGSTLSDTDTAPDVTSPLYIGWDGDQLKLNGWLDELRISKGIARIPVLSCTNITQQGKYFLAQNINNWNSATNQACINISVSNVELDCQGFTIDGVDRTGTSGILTDGTTSATLSNILVKNCRITDFSNGIQYDYTKDSTIINSTLSSNSADGIQISSGSNNNVTNVSLSSNGDNGIQLSSASYNNLTRITSSNNVGNSIYIYSSPYNTLRNFDITKAASKGGIYVSSTLQSGYVQNIDNSNLVNGRAVQYFDGVTKTCPNGQTLDYGSTYSHLTLVGCNNVIAKTNADDIIMLAFTSYSVIEDSTLTGSRYGIFLRSGTYNAITNVSISNAYGGVYLSASTRNTIANSTISGNLDDGVYVTSSSDYNNFTSLTLSNNDNGIALFDGTRSTIYNVTSFNSLFDGIDIASLSDYTTVTDSYLFRNGDEGISIDSDLNRLINITLSENDGNGIYFGSNSNARNEVINSTIRDNKQHGIDFYRSAKNNITGSRIENNSAPNYAGIYFSSPTLSSTTNATKNRLWDNIINNTLNWETAGINSTNYFNTTLTAGTNIIGKNNIGGNFWASPIGNGFSQTCSDANADGICDSYYIINSTNAVDFLALSTQGASPNNLPTQGTPRLYSSSGQNLTSDDLICKNQSTADVDGNKVTNIYNWLRTGQSLMILNMPFDTNSTTVKDYSGYSSIGAVNENTNWSAGVNGGAYHFDGYADNIKVDHQFIIPEKGSIELWVKTNDVTSDQVAFFTGCSSFVAPCPTDSADGFGGTQELEVHIRNGYLAFFWGDEINGIEVDAITLNVSISNNIWYHVVGVYDNGNYMKLYVNGVLVKQNLTAPVYKRDRWDKISVLGKPPQYNYPWRGLNGSLDGFRIWNTTLTSQQIMQLYLESKDGYSDSSTIKSTELTAGDVWQCEITPNDGKDDGVTLDSSILTVASAPPVSSKWKHVVVTYSSSTHQKKIYINGVLKKTEAISSSGSYTINNPSANVYLSALRGIPGIPFNGTVDDIKVYSDSLTQDKIMQEYSNELIFNKLPQQNEANTFTLPGEDVQELVIAPIVRVGNKEKICSATTRIKLPACA